MLYHSIAFFLGFLLDLILGDPYWLPHPIRLIGNLIVVLEKRFLSKETKGKEHKEQERKASEEEEHCWFLSCCL